jgi:large subunit ribosomal protein L44
MTSVCSFLLFRRILRPATVLAKNSRYIGRDVERKWIYFNRKRKEYGPDPPTPRSSFLEWNYSAELYAFQRRVGETFEDDTLRTALTHKSYLEAEERKRREMGVPIQEAPLDLKENTALISKGADLMRRYTEGFLRYAFPYLPEEGVKAICGHLMSDQVLTVVASGLGIKDLVLCEEFPPTERTLAESVKAVVGALLQNQDAARAQLFVQDFVLTQLIGADVNDIWEIVNPMGVLAAILEREGRGAPEPRLIRESGRTTIEAVYVVGIYSDKKFLGSGPGETLDTAEEMAARDALKRMFRTTDKQTPLPFGSEGRKLNLDQFMNRTSPGLEDWTGSLAAPKTSSQRP